MQLNKAQLNSAMLNDAALDLTDEQNTEAQHEPCDGEAGAVESDEGEE